MQLPTFEEEDAFLAALVERDVDRIASMLALHPAWAHTVRSCRQPTVHYLLLHGGGDVEDSNGDTPHPQTCSTDPDSLPKNPGQSNATRDGAVNTIACIDLLVAHGAALDATDPSSGNSVLHSIVAPREHPTRSTDGPLVFERHVLSVLKHLLCHSYRPSLHCLNRLGFTAAVYACHVGNVSALDAFFATSLSDALHCTAVLGAGASMDGDVDRMLCGLPMAVAMGALVQAATPNSGPEGGPFDGTVSFPCHSMPWVAAQQGQHVVLRYLLELRVDVSMVSRIVALEGRGGYTAPERRVPLFELEPLPWMAAGATTLWQRVGAPLHVACSHYRDNAPNATSLMAVVALMLRYMHNHHITTAERDEEAARLAEPFHDHIPEKTPAAVFRLLRFQDAAGRCAMHHAADGKCDGTVRLMEYLLSIDPTMLQSVDRGGRTPLDAALKSNKTTNADWLVQRFGVKSLGHGTLVRGSRPQRTC